MRFHFCGGLDAPDWLLANVAILSNISSVQLKFLSIAIMKEICEAEIFDYDKALKRTEGACKDIKEVKSAIASILFIISNAARFDIEEQQLSLELQQIGLPKESSESLCRSYKSNKDKLVQHFKTKTLRLPKIDELKWRVDLVLSSSTLKSMNEPTVQLNLKILHSEEHGSVVTHERFELSADKFRILYNELKDVRQLMEEYMK
ncbi:hypothetical protein FDP41_004724 [Naegleria fowleri]|uniref:COMM domain-containing protein n=1 Tax=Naegleria fowleri TaxID=5763 RepID=A0A6A5BPD3_NAEFO|nr:uncharacterized protein FDP41_004724 [Naegleria fowleri]KAF0976048.1 hypothetical protein FDP41_004724 [Naegleria fowleri]CAG4716475.1 unnamed protein product [Naegleria fowleri]